jgi:hypothetical protein
MKRSRFSETELVYAVKQVTTGRECQPDWTKVGEQVPLTTALDVTGLVSWFYHELCL